MLLLRSFICSFPSMSPFHVPCQLVKWQLFCWTTPLLPSGTWQQNLMECWWEASVPTARSPTSVSDTAGQYDKVGDITFGAASIY